MPYGTLEHVHSWEPAYVIGEWVKVCRCGAMQEKPLRERRAEVRASEGEIEKWA